MDPHKATKSPKIEGARDAAEGQLEAAHSRLARLRDTEQSKNALISHRESLVPQALSGLSSKRKIASTRRCIFTSSASVAALLLPIWVVMTCLYLLEFYIYSTRSQVSRRADREQRSPSGDSRGGKGL